MSIPEDDFPTKPLAAEQPFSNVDEQRETDPVVLLIATKTFADVESRLPLDGREVGDFNYYLEGVKAGYVAGLAAGTAKAKS